MVRIDADEVISVRNVLNKQYGSPKRHGYASQIAYNSGGRPSDHNDGNELQLKLT